jgi:hypothetical protein
MAREAHLAEWHPASRAHPVAARLPSSRPRFGQRPWFSLPPTCSLPRSCPYPHQMPVEAKAEFSSSLDSPSRFPARLCSALFAKTPCLPRPPLPSPTSKVSSPSHHAPITESSCQPMLPHELPRRSPFHPRGAHYRRSPPDTVHPWLRLPELHLGSTPLARQPPPATTGLAYPLPFLFTDVRCHEQPIGELPTSSIPHN